jgi:nucleoside-diphosphate-sugar epimerase
MSQTLYVTGGTGFVGSHFVRNCLPAGRRQIRCFVRGSSRDACTERVRQAVEAANESYPERHELNLDGLTGIPADITRPALGLSDSWIDEESATSPDGTFFHFASSLRFDEPNKEAIYEHNIRGLTNAIEVAARLKCAVFFYISTAYTAGVHDGLAPEQLHRPAAFNNYYEETKCAAEHLAVELCGARGMRLVIVRPSVVIGPSVSCKTGGSTTGLYGLIRDIHRLKRHIERIGMPLVVFLNPDAGVNFIPVDYVCHDILRLFENPDIPEGIHHATADNNVSVRVLIHFIARHLELPAFRLQHIEQFDFERAQPIERLVFRTMAYYNSITATTKRFEKRSGAAWTISADEVERYVVEAVRGLAPSPEGQPRSRELCSQVE